MKNIFLALLLILVAANISLADDTSFHRVKVPNLRGKQIKAVLTFSDTHGAVEVRPVKGGAVNIPYTEISKCTYEFTKRHRINDFTILTAPVGVGAVVMITKYKSHWLEIDYREHDMSKAFVLRMHKREYIGILEALKAHTGIDAEILGNADKR